MYFNKFNIEKMIHDDFCTEQIYPFGTLIKHKYTKPLIKYYDDIFTKRNLRYITKKLE